MKEIFDGWHTHVSLNDILCDIYFSNKNHLRGWHIFMRPIWKLDRSMEINFS